jgi:hypothetical protein
MSARKTSEYGCDMFLTIAMVVNASLGLSLSWYTQYSRT